MGIVTVRVNERLGTYTLTVLEGSREVGIGDAVYYSKNEAEQDADELLCRVLAERELTEVGERQAALLARYPRS